MLSPGQKLGSYEIVAPLGAGGMGEVWRARDTRLGRDVAVKVLPASLATDSAAGARFEREARAVAALSHPNVLSIFDFGRVDGTAFAVMELLDGATLREALLDGALPPRRSVDIAREIALGLAAAHAKGIVHRDLKPENVFVTKDGRVKILDFGLAKETAPAGGSGSQLATLEQQTEPGTVLGTVGYMSPEQVRGQAVDARTDVFALGAILYELLAGRRAFGGVSSADTMSAILREDPPEISGESGAVPPALERVVRRCLEKSPDQRFHSAADVAFALDAISAPSAGGTRTGITEAVTARRALPWRTVSAALALLAVGAGAALLLRGRGRPLPRFHRLTFQRGFVAHGRFAPDGAAVVYTAGWEGDVFRSFTTRADATTSRPLDLPPSSVLSISKGGELALLLHSARTSERGTLALAPLAGGAPRALAENVRWADFLPDGGGLAVSRCGLADCALESPLGTVRVRSTGLIGGVAPAPDGRSIAFWDWSGPTMSIRLLELPSGRVRSLVPGLVAVSPALVWHRGEIWYSGTDGTSPPAIFAVDPKGGAPRPVLRSPTAMNLCDVAPDGRVLLASATWRTALLCSTPAHPAERDLSWMDWSTPRDLSDDGKTILFNEGREAARGKPGIWIRPTDGGPAVRLGDGNGLALSPDGTQALALLGGSSPPRLALWPTGPGTPTFIEAPAGLVFVSAFFLPDGKRLVVAAREPEKPLRLYTLELPGGAPRAFTGDVASGMAVSPDGTLVAGGTLDGKIALFPVAGGPPRVVPGLAGSTVVVRFAPDGRSIYVHEKSAYPLRVERVDVATGQKTPWKELAPADLSGVTGMGFLRMTPDARTYVYGVQHHFSDLSLVEGLE